MVYFFEEYKLTGISGLAISPIALRTIEEHSEPSGDKRFWRGLSASESE